MFVAGAVSIVPNAQATWTFLIGQELTAIEPYLLLLTRLALMLVAAGCFGASAWSAWPTLREWWQRDDVDFANLIVLAGQVRELYHEGVSDSSPENDFKEALASLNVHFYPITGVSNITDIDQRFARLVALMARRDIREARRLWPASKGDYSQYLTGEPSYP